ncbi:MAG: NADP(H)-dependent aldo-keto reductase [Bacteroidota bacterium]
MQYRQLGDTDLEVSLICLGTMTFGEQNSEQEAHEQLDYALDQGINFIDTAELYAVPSSKENNGKTEEYIGTWLKNRPDRDKIIVATKVTGPSMSGGLKYIRPNLGFSKEAIHDAIEGSLRRLQTDYVDLYQLHWPERRANFFSTLGYKHHADDKWVDNFLEILETLDGLVKQGKIRHFGISNETPWGLMRFVHLAETHNLPRPVSIQNPYNLLNRSFEVGLAEAAIREKCGLLAYSPMAFGLLSGKYHKKEERSGARLNVYKQLSRYNGKQSYDATSEYLKIAQENGLSMAQMALAYINSRPFLTSNIIGATSMKQLKENIESHSVQLSKEVLEAIEKVHLVYSNPAP